MEKVNIYLRVIGLAGAYNFSNFRLTLISVLSEIPQSFIRKHFYSPYYFF